MHTIYSRYMAGFYLYRLLEMLYADLMILYTKVKFGVIERIFASKTKFNSLTKKSSSKSCTLCSSCFFQAIDNYRIIKKKNIKFW